ncbi:MAG: hypothetical protein L0216_12645 [Planctomycetales bacterium]|nr:hypothetical protein [Planctomycetales bacterium]
MKTTLKSRPAPRARTSAKPSCEECGKAMERENTARVRETLFLLWKCPCGHQMLERRPLVESPVVQAED